MRNAPNILTVSRIFFSFLLLGVVLYADILFPPPIHPSWVDYFAGLVFIVASITDFFDGFIAREYKITSTFGEVFDPLADKMLILSAFLVLILLNRADVWAIFLILSREFFVTGLRIVAASKGLKVGASHWGKSKMFFQITAVTCLLLNFLWIGNIFLWIATAITLYSGYDYFRSYLLVKE